MVEKAAGAVDDIYEVLMQLECKKCNNRGIREIKRVAAAVSTWYKAILGI